MQYIVTSYGPTGRGRVELCLNHKFSFQLYTKEVRQFSLKEGAELSEEQYQYILHEVLGKRATKRAMHLLERQERTEYQLREKLKQNAYPQEAIEEAVAYVKGYHYLDDARYARTFIRFHQERRSRMRLKTDLMKRGVPKEIIEESLEEEFLSDEREQIMELLEKRGFDRNAQDEAEFRKNYQFLMRRGFKSSDILSVMKSFDGRD